ncbi:hypothetical protein [Dysgonomonas sp. 511]|uniref:hypothetical protein n=1 Tax=Dysgonomonas sp. 511 TaxID=2302930 RepID=UPI0013D66CCF|nr:hypothetical protein [Dysgonomonas sp. 511]NDV80348.1 hypothetical protein [Dysgonomonas sp. 511]
MHFESEYAVGLYKPFYDAVLLKLRVLVVNASNIEKDWKWLTEHNEERADLDPIEALRYE